MNPNLAGRLSERALRHAERAAVIQGSGRRTRSVTFGELDARVRETSAALVRDGVGPGERVLLFVPMSIDLYTLLLGVLHAGAVAVFVDAWADRRRLDAAVRAARPALFVGTPRAQALRLLSPSVRRIPRHWIRGGGLLPARRRTGDPRILAPVRVGADDPALVTFTTGSTGAPKAAARSHAFLWAQHEALARHLDLHEGDVDMPTLPVFVLNNLALGVTSVIPDFDPRRPADIRPRRIVRQMREHGVTTTSGSPAFYERLAGWTEARGERLELRGLWTGGAPVTPRLAERLDRMIRGRAHVLYGSTEAEPIAAVEAGAMVRAMARASPLAGLLCGKPDPGVALRILRPFDGPIELGADGWDGWAAAPGEVGEIAVAGAHVLGEYHDAPEETRRHKIRDGDRVWHRTGDAGRVDAEGRLWLMGRIGGRVRRRGRVWWPVPAELAALGIPGVRHAAYLGLAGGERGDRAVLCLEGVRPDTDLEIDARRALGIIPVDEVRVLKRIPRDPRHASKTDTPALRRLLAE